MNRVILIGRITKDPELRKTQNGMSTCSFSLAVDRAKKKDGTKEADFINCVAWQKTAELICQYMHKGSQIGLEGRIQTRSYDNKSGQKVYVTEVVADNIQFLDSRQSQQAQPRYAQQTYQQPAYTQPSYQQPPANPYGGYNSDDDIYDIPDSDLPF